MKKCSWREPRATYSSEYENWLAQRTFWKKNKDSPSFLEQKETSIVFSNVFNVGMHLQHVAIQALLESTHNVV